MAKDDDGNRFFKIGYLTKRLVRMPNIDELRKVDALSEAVFLKTGPTMTVFSLKDTEAEALFSLLQSGNPGLNAVWSDLDANKKGPALPDIDFFAVEGNPRLVTHLRRERNPSSGRMVLPNVGREDRAAGCIGFEKHCNFVQYISPPTRSMGNYG